MVVFDVPHQPRARRSNASEGHRTAAPWPILVIAALLLVATAGTAAADFVVHPGMTAPPSARAPLPNYSEEHFLVRLAPGADRQAFARQVRQTTGANARLHSRFDDYVSVSFSAATHQPSQAASAAAGLSALSAVENVRPHLLMHAHSFPNDPFFKNYGDPTMDPDLMDNQYYLFDVNAPQAWALEKGSPDTVIAVIDSGVSVFHEDLADKIVPGWDFVGDNVGWWVGAESEEDPTSQDDNPTVWDPAWGQPHEHGYPGFDIFSDDAERAAWWAEHYDPAIGDTVSNNPAIDPYGSADSGVAHGTLVAAMAGAVTDNNLGMAGMAWYPSIMPVRVINAEGWGFGIDAADAIYWAVDNGADVLNLSWGFGPMYTIDPAELQPGGEGYLVQQALEYAHERGVMIIASAGNADGAYPDYGDHEYFGDGISHSGGLDFPANLPQTISVGSTNESQTKSSFSSYADPLLGEILDVTAPGESLETGGMWTCSLFNAYDWWLWGELLTGEPFLPLGEDLYTAGAMGTSFSAPIVSGLAALIKSRYPFLTNDDLREILWHSAQDLGDPGYDPYFGYGLLDAGYAIEYSDVYVSEPVTASLFLTGIAVLGWRARRRRAA